MRVAVFNGADRPITIETIADPEPGPGEVVVEVARCGICGSDISMTSGGPFDFAAGTHLGHEYAGEVVALGAGVTGTRIGDRVACIPMGGCGACEMCRAGRPNFCLARSFLAGGFGRYVALPTRNLVPLPKSLSLSDGALVEPMAVGLHALRMAGFRSGERLLVLGAGSTALAVTYWARRMGAARIAIASRSAHRAEAALALGADAVIGFDEADPAAIEAATGGAPDIVAECVGKPGMLGKAIGLVRRGGTVVSLGMCAHADTVVPALGAFKEIRLIFPLAYTVGEFEETARAFDAGDVHPDLMVSDVIGLAELPAKIAAMRAGERNLKVHVDPKMETQNGGS